MSQIAQRKQVKTAGAARSASAPEQLRAERLSAIGQLSSGLSADLRQSLGVIRNSIHFLNISLGESLDDKVRRHLTLLLREVNSINRIAANLEALTSKRVPERQPTDVQLLVATALGRIAVPQNVSVEPLVPDGSRLYCDPDQMACALANLVMNAVQALPDGGRVRIGCRGSDDELVMTVTDGGIGMTDEVLVQAFEPLFTTSPHRTGLGLTVVRALTGANGGTVMLESRPGQGTTATLRFPRFD